MNAENARATIMIVAGIRSSRHPTPAPVAESLVKRYSVKHLTNDALLHGLKALVAHDRVTTAEMLAHMAEVDERRLYAPAGYPSMYAYCVGEFHLAEEAAFKRIHAARAARRFPVLKTARRFWSPTRQTSGCPH